MTNTSFLINMQNVRQNTYRLYIYVANLIKPIKTYSVTVSLVFLLLVAYSQPYLQHSPWPHFPTTTTALYFNVPSNIYALSLLLPLTSGTASIWCCLPDFLCQNLFFIKLLYTTQFRPSFLVSFPTTSFLFLVSLSDCEPSRQCSVFLPYLKCHAHEWCSRN